MEYPTVIKELIFGYLELYEYYDACEGKHNWKLYLKDHHSIPLIQTVQHDNKIIDLELIKLLYQHNPDQLKVDKYALDHPAYHNHIEILRYLHSVGARCSKLVIEYAMNSKNIEILRFLNEVVGVGNNYTYKAMDYAYDSGCEEIMDYMINKMGNCDGKEGFKHSYNKYHSINLYQKMCKDKNMKMIKLFIANGFSIDLYHLLFYTDSSFLFKILEMFIDANLLSFNINNVIYHERLDILKFLYKYDKPKKGHKSKFLLKKTVNLAATLGKLDIIKYLIEIGATYSTKSGISVACQHGHLEVIKYFHNLQFLDYIKYLEPIELLFPLRKIRCTRGAMNQACIFGHLDVVKYLHENGVEIKQKHIDAATKHNRQEILEYLSKYFKKN